MFCAAIFFYSFFLSKDIKAACPPETPCYKHCYYTCDNPCGGVLIDWECDTCCNGPDRIAQQSTGSPWQECNPTTGKHYCDKACLKPAAELPKNPKWYDDPTKNNDATADKGNTNNALPIVLDWELDSWKDGGKYNPNGSLKAMAQSNYGSNSFLIEIDNPDNQLFEPEKVPNSTYDATKKVFSKCLTNDFFNSRDDGLACFFRAGKKDIKYRVKACCTADCNDCGPFVDWKFSTGDFPEPKSPLDPDWNGPNAATDVPFKSAKLEWCQAWVTKKSPNDWAKSFQLMATSNENGAQACHPLLVSGGQCRATDIVADTSDNKVRHFYPVVGRTDHNFFTRNLTYVWKMKMCFDESSAQCGDYGQAWSFITKNDSIGVPEPITPPNDTAATTPIGMPVSISWSIPSGANSFVFESTFTTGGENLKINSIPNLETADALKKKFDAPNLEADKLYKWRVKACSKFNSQVCDAFSEWFYFQTTGRPPKAESMAHTDGIPKTFSWGTVPGAKSYNFKLSLGVATTANGTTTITEGTESATSTISGETLLASPKATVGYPSIDKAKSYIWKVQTCAHSDGTICGAWSETKSFTTPELTDPIDPIDPIETVYYPRNVSWYAVPGASAYHYILKLVTPTETNCTQESIEKTVQSPIDSIDIKCLGTYEVSVRPCIDRNCQSMGPESKWNFVLGQKIPDLRPMLTVCGTEYDLPDTSWNEREDCQPKHILLLAQVVINFVIFKVSIYLLPILLLITGLLFYFAQKTPEIWEKIRSMWKAIGIGFGLLLLAWIIVGLLLQTIGFPGIWWKIL